MQAGEINRLTSNVTDPACHTPAYKELSARLERVDGPDEHRGASAGAPTGDAGRPRQDG